MRKELDGIAYLHRCNLHVSSKKSKMAEKKDLNSTPFDLPVKLHATTKNKQ